MGGRGEQAMRQGVGLFARFEGRREGGTVDLHRQRNVLDEGEDVGVEQDGGDWRVIDRAEIEGEETLEHFEGGEDVQFVTGEAGGVDQDEGRLHRRGFREHRDHFGGARRFGGSADTNRGFFDPRGGHQGLGGEQGQRAGENGQGLGSEPERSRAGCAAVDQRDSSIATNEHRFIRGESQVDRHYRWFGGVEAGMRGGAAGALFCRAPYNASLRDFVSSWLKRKNCVQTAHLDG